MKKLIFGILLAFYFVFNGAAQEKLDYFLPDDVTYNKNIPTPEAYFQQQVGEWHLNYEQVLSYMKEVAQLSGRAIIQEYARSYENRPLVYVIFTSEKNQNNLDDLKQRHVAFSEPGSTLSEEDVPLVVTLGYGVHGNESSGPNSSVLTAYYLAAAQGAKIDKLLSQTIILVDPCLNPDGFTRHSTWANMHQSASPVGDSNSRQYNEVWPGGRTNHYWFDLNRDYLLLVHPESRGRITEFHEWKPNIVTDHHEMGANSTFFFQPGVPSRNNPLTPEENYTLTHEIATHHAKFLDKIGADYYSEEQYDDFYFGKGSSYPDVNGGIGILFEQAGFRSRVRETSNGMRKLAYGIRNHFTVTLSTLDAAVDMKEKLLNFQKEFYTEALQLADKDPVKAYIFGDKNDKVKTEMFIDILRRHQIDVFKNEKEFKNGNDIFTAGNSYVVPLKQKQYRLIKSIFDVATTFADSTFYDVSTWTFPYAFNLPFAEINSLKNVKHSETEVEYQPVKGTIIGGKSESAYLFRWDEYSTPTALYSLQKAGLITKVATQKFSFEIDGKNEQFTYGTILIPVNNQRLGAEQIFRLVSNAAEKTGVDFYSVSTGLSPEGIDLGSGSFEVLKKPEVLMFVAGSVRSNDAGEIWHLFDQRYQIPVCLTQTDQLKSINLNRYNTIILPGGSYSEWGKAEAEKLKEWTQQGGTLIAYKNAATWASRNNLGKTTFKKSEAQDTTLHFSYAERSKEYSLKTISGAIFNTEMDITHPLCYGYSRNKLAVFKTGTSVAESLNKEYTEPVNYTASPYISGFVSEKNTEQIKDAPVVSVQSIGRGNLISYYESMTFRGFWLGTNKLFTNAVFFGNTIR
jgi:hypothetical protein